VPLIPPALPVLLIALVLPVLPVPPMPPVLLIPPLPPMPPAPPLPAVDELALPLELLLAEDDEVLLGVLHCGSFAHSPKPGSLIK
jgi:hypothetical protein